ncbi:hypothetical protein PV371_36675 [Streptomyces sp. TX20-6-3]|uniref:hypothetical protein n=1 Tax=Streptomyces sp. TX20-6-3 TaxID=3028705 RepID=UPI0029B28BF4|nr:hypothetical protein [Streptomyces sp. TX20-6-3]MDX2565160.1 hypothetical protein [Streptomyces sp. TX20-6-3]
MARLVGCQFAEPDRYTALIAADAGKEPHRTATCPACVQGHGPIRRRGDCHACGGDGGSLICTLCGIEQPAAYADDF